MNQDFLELNGQRHIWVSFAKAVLLLKMSVITIQASLELNALKQLRSVSMMRYFKNHTHATLLTKVKCVNIATLQVNRLKMSPPKKIISNTSVSVLQMVIQVSAGRSLVPKLWKKKSSISAHYSITTNAIHWTETTSGPGKINVQTAAISSGLMQLKPCLL